MVIVMLVKKSVVVEIVVVAVIEVSVIRDSGERCRGNIIGDGVSVGNNNNSSSIKGTNDEMCAACPDVG